MRPCLKNTVCAQATVIRPCLCAIGVCSSGSALSFCWAVEHRLCPEVFDWLILQGFCKAGHLVRRVRGWTCPAFHVFPAIPFASTSVIGLVILVVLHASWPDLCPCEDTVTSSLGRCCVLQGSVFSLAPAPALTHTLLPSSSTAGN